MTIGALALEVIGWPVVARLAVRKAIVVKVRPTPRAGRMATGTLPGEMVGWTIVRVARLAIGLPAVIKSGRSPGIRQVAGRTLSLKVVGWTVV